MSAPQQQGSGSDEINEKTHPLLFQAQFTGHVSTINANDPDHKKLDEAIKYTQQVHDEKKRKEFEQESREYV